MVILMVTAMSTAQFIVGMDNDRSYWKFYIQSLILLLFILKSI